MLIKAKKSDIGWIVDAQIVMAQETESLHLDRDVVLQGVSAVFEDSQKGQYWIAKAKGDNIACLLTVNEWSDWRAGHVLWIHSVYVQASHRGQGVFKDMYQELRQMVLENDYLKGLRLYVDQSNIAAQKVYEACGMQSGHYSLYEWLPLLET